MPLGGFADQLTAEGTIRSTFDAITISLYSQFLQKTKPEGQDLGGIGEQIKMGASISAVMGGAFSINGNADYVLINDVMYLDVPIDEDGGTADFAALADLVKLQITGKFQPTDWSYISGMFGYSMYTYQVPFDAETKSLVPRFQQAVPSEIQEYKLLIGVSKSF